MIDATMPLDERKRQILKAVIYDYTETGIPVGSNAVAAQLSSWSSATIRNELANLVSVGYLRQPHTSAGRVPSDLGYRYYVDFLMEEESIPARVRRQMDPHLSEIGLSLEQLLEVAAMVLALATEGVSLVTGPRLLSSRLKHLDLVSLAPRRALLLLVLEGSHVRQQTMALESEVDQERLSQLASSLNRELSGRDTQAIAGRQEGDRLRAEVIGQLLSVMRTVDSHQDALVLHDGVRNLLRQPEFGDHERLQQVLDVVEEERVLSELLSSLEVEGVQVMIGRETGVEQLSECSLVLTTYAAGAGRSGTVGVLGPTRMRYSQVAPRVRYVSQRIGLGLSRILN